jgi:enoyl-CoA hydratase/3-hydroxyacyl-CoA dehydrogenase
MEREKIMDQKKPIYGQFFNPLLYRPDRPLPKQMAVIGAGTIGPDIGYYLKSALPDTKLFLVDVVEKALESAEKRLAGYAQKAVARRKMSEDQAAGVLANIVYTTDYNQIAGCELVIEAATESIPLKQKIFAQVEGIVSPKAVITSNTSSIPADRMFNEMKHPERTSITHFFAPAWRSLPVEVINWEGASQETVDYLFWFFGQTGKAPIITDNAICFVLDRVFDNWCNEAAYLLADATASQIDAVAEEFVFAGPFFVLNLANGNPIIVETNTLQMEEGAHYRPARILESVGTWNTHRPGKGPKVDDALKGKIRDRLLGILFSQSFDIIDKGIGTKEDLNFGCQVALGFRKGPLDIMRDLGREEVDRIMQRFQADRPGFPMPGSSYDEYQRFYRFLLLDDIDGVKVITLRRPQAMNAINDEITAEIQDVLERFADDPAVKGFVLTGYGQAAFSAGADIGKFPQMLGDREASAQYARDCAKVQRVIDGMQKPVVAAVNGFAMGGGLELAIRCHRIVATAGSTFQFPEITLGILPGIGGCAVPYRRWPQGAAVFNEMICLGKPLKTAQAAEIGMVYEVAADTPELIDLAVAAVNDLAGNLPAIPAGPMEAPAFDLPNPPMAGKLALSKEAVALTVKTVQDSAAAESLEAALEIGYQGFGDIACLEAAKEGVTAFLQKRKPVFEK